MSILMVWELDNKFIANAILIRGLIMGFIVACVRGNMEWVGDIYTKDSSSLTLKY